MISKIDGNKMSLDCLELTADKLNIGTKHILKQIKFNYKYEEGKKTDEYLDTTISVLDTHNFATLDIHVKERLSITQKELECSEEIIYIEIDPMKTIVKPYKVEYGKVLCKISTDFVIVTN